VARKLPPIFCVNCGLKNKKTQDFVVKKIILKILKIFEKNLKKRLTIYSAFVKISRLC